MRWYFLVFLVSGFASLVDEVVWVRLAMASFGVTTALVSIVLSIFMAGLAIGSWAGGIAARRFGRSREALRAYAAVEAVIGLSAIAVPAALDWGRAALAGAAGASWGSSTYYVASAALIAGTLAPFCIAMGATFPFAIAAIRGERGEPSPRSFSYLYLANVLGATAGTLASALVLVEILGFRGTLLASGALNLALAVLALRRSSAVAKHPTGVRHARSAAADNSTRSSVAVGNGWLLGGLFMTGLCSMAMEVVWLRQFGPYLGPEVYTFAAVLAVYLGATFLGSQVYRATDPTRLRGVHGFWTAAGCAALAGLVAVDPRVPIPPLGRVVLGVAPVCAVLGFLTPMLLDRWSRGEADRAGRGYALNVLGAIVGPLVAGFVLIPWVSERLALLILATPLVAVGVLAAPGSPGPLPRRLRGSAIVAVVSILVIVLAVGSTRPFEAGVPNTVVRRDHTATVMAEVSPASKRLFVNGHATAGLSPVTKWMAHLPLAFLDRPPRDALVICFGMGTTFRSLLAWDIDATAVELVPSVPALFGFFHADGPALLRSPRGKVVIDDGRRFLERSREQFDVVTVDPPPPLEAAGTSLLYSREFYEAVKRRLRPGGIVQQWIPSGEIAIIASAARALGVSFPHVRVFPAVSREPFGVAGLHFLASERELPRLPGDALASRLPAAAAKDLMEWEQSRTPGAVFDELFAWEMPLTAVVAFAPWAPSLEDDRPFNEYYVVRRWIFPRTPS